MRMYSIACRLFPNRKTRTVSAILIIAFMSACLCRSKCFGATSKEEAKRDIQTAIDARTKALKGFHGDEAKELFEHDGNIQAAQQSLEKGDYVKASDFASYTRDGAERYIKKKQEEAAKLLKSLADHDAEYQGYLIAEERGVSHVDAVAVKSFCDLKYSSRYLEGSVGAVKMSQKDQNKAAQILNEQLQNEIKFKQNANSKIRLVVICNQSMGVKLGGGAIWSGIPLCETESEVKSKGVSLGMGMPITPLVSGTLCIVDSKNKLVVDYRSITATGFDWESALKAFIKAVADDISKNISVAE
jgi:hypothetical protein